MMKKKFIVSLLTVSLFAASVVPAYGGGLREEKGKAIYSALSVADVSAGRAEASGLACAEQHKDELKNTQKGTIEHPVKASPGAFIKNGNQWSYQYEDGTLAKNTCLIINKKIYYFNKYSQRWYGLHTLNGKNITLVQRIRAGFTEIDCLPIRETPISQTGTVP